MPDTAIRDARESREIIIHPYKKENLTPVGYNFSYSRFIVSLSKKNFINLVDDTKTGELYFDLRPSETVLVLTKETVSVSASIGGTFHSKVSLVTKGLGHVSTTLDPGWQGQLLVPLNNPTNKKVRIYLVQNSYNEKEQRWELVENTFLTLVFFKAQEGASNKSTNKPARIELLEEIIKTKRQSKARQKLIEQVGKISAVYKSENIIDLSTMSSRRTNYDHYVQQQNTLNTALESNYPLIKQTAKRVSINGYVQFISIGLAIFIALLSMSLYGFFTTNANISDLTKILVPILTSFGIFFLTHIKERFI